MLSPSFQAKAVAPPLERLQPNPKGKLQDQFHEVARFKHLSVRTEQAYWEWVVRYLKFHRDRAGSWQRPEVMGSQGVTPFLTWLATERDVAISTQNQALNALLFLYREVLSSPMQAGDFVRVIRPPNLPTVLTREEVRELLAELSGNHLLMAQLLYGSGLRLLEMLRLRVKDIDFGRGQVMVRAGKGGKDRVTVLPQSLREPLQKHLTGVRAQHNRDLAEGFGEAPLPTNLRLKYPNAGKAWIWQWVFPSGNRSTDPATGMIARHHTTETGLQRKLKEALERTTITKPATCHASAGIRHGHPHRPGIARPQERGHHTDLHPRDAEIGDRRQKPAGWLSSESKI